jgi:c-di-GMP-related signal transduction protein
MSNCFIARQAILKDNLAVLGYDLVFRPQPGSAPGDTAPSAAFAIDAATMVFPWEFLVGAGLAFISFGSEELVNGAALLLPRAKSVVDVPPSVPCDAEVILACQELKSAGYRLSVSGWTGQKERRPLAALADFLRVDLPSLLAAPASQRYELGLYAPGILLASNVRSWEEHQQARHLGFSFFHGDYFLKPQLFRRREIAGTRLSALRLLEAVLRDPLPLSDIEHIVREEPALSYKLLRYLNSPVMERRVEVQSIRSAISLLGDNEFRRWAALVGVTTPATDKPNELLRVGLTRAYFCEQLALRRHSTRTYDYFFTGLFSVMDAVLDRPLDEIVNDLALPERVRAALRGEPGELQEALRAAIAYEQGHWLNLEAAMKQIALPESCAPDCFVAAGRAVSAILA